MNTSKPIAAKLFISASTVDADALTIRGKDYEYDGELSEFGKKFHYGTRGTGGMTHNDPDRR